MSRIGVIFKRELIGYFATPIAAVFIIIFLMLAGAFTFYLGNFFARGQADLIPFFDFHPWLYLVLIPALAMRLWAEERRGGHHRIAVHAARDLVGSRGGQVSGGVVLYGHCVGADLSHVGDREYPGGAG